MHDGNTMSQNTPPNSTAKAASSQRTTAGLSGLNVEMRALPKEPLRSVDAAKLKLQVDKQSLLFQTEAEKNRLEKIVLLLVVVGILLFAIFQIIQCVGAYAQPISTSNLENRSRVLPGLMICPFAGTEFGFRCATSGDRADYQALWAPDATLSFDFRNPRRREFFSSCTINSKSYDSSDAFAILSIVDPLSLAKRSKCPNAYPLEQFDQYGGSPPLLFGALDLEVMKQNRDGRETQCDSGSSARRVTVKNTGKSLICSSEGCSSRQSHTPPNVQCMVLDPSFFDEDSKGTPGADPSCNPMREVNSNTVDAFQIAFPFISQPASTRRNERYGTWEYSGLRCPKLSPSQLKLSVEDFALQLSSFDDDYKKNPNYNNMTLFGNFVALAYDSEKGVPKDIDFDDVTSPFSNGAISSSQQGHILASTILTHVERFEETVPPRSTPPYLTQRVVPVTLQASIAVQTRYPNAAQGDTTTTITTTTPSAVFVPLINNPYRLPSSLIVVSFSTVLTTVTREVVTLSILTTISIIVSTASALWGAQEKIKDGILMVAAKVNEIRGAAQPKHL
jgi:hypothetical protein